MMEKLDERKEKILRAILKAGEISVAGGAEKNRDAQVKLESSP